MAAHWIRSRASLLAAPFAALACTLVNDPQRGQCETDADCQSYSARATCADGFCVADTSPLGCLADPPNPDTDQPTPFRVDVIRVTSQQPMPGVEIRLCSLADVDCTTPLATELTNAGGSVELIAPAHALTTNRIFIEATYEGVVPQIHYPQDALFTQQLAALEGKKTRIDMLTAAEITTIAEIGGLEYDPSLALLFVLVNECNARRLDGVRFAVDRTTATSSPFFLIGTTIEPLAAGTDYTGRGGFVNLPDGSIRLTAEYVDTGEIVGDRSYLTRAGWWTNVVLAPDAVRGLPR
jgi:hypothetical protein